jgi:hypothetical protein
MCITNYAENLTERNMRTLEFVVFFFQALGRIIRKRAA